MRSKAGITIGILLAVLLGLGIYVTQRREWIQNRILDAFIKKISPKLPFSIDSYKLSRNLDYFEIHLHRGDFTVSLAGPLKADWIGKRPGWDFDYDPEAVISGVGRVRLHAHASLYKSDVTLIRVELDPASAPRLSVPAAGLVVEQPRLRIDVDPGKDSLAGLLELSTKSVTWTDPRQPDHAASAEGLTVDASYRPELAEARIRGKGGELLWGDLYRELPLASLPVDLRAEDPRDPEAPVSIRIGTGSHAADFEVNRKTGARFRVPALPLEPIARWAASDRLEGLELKGGTISASGGIRWDGPAGLRLTDARARLQRLSLRSEKGAYAARGLGAEIEYAHGRALQSLRVEADSLHYRHLTGHLGPTAIQWGPERFSTTGPLPLKVEGIPLTIGPIEAALAPELRLQTSVRIDRMPLDPLAAGFCLPASKVPPGELVLDFRRIEAGRNFIDPTGRASVDLFGGRVELNEISYYDFDTDVPELDFDARWEGLQLEALGNWLRFGEIKGTLEGYAEEVVFQKFLPTHYHFMIHAKPMPGERFVEFSPDAMKNTVKLFTGENLDEQIPGIASWLMFGWPSRFFGGYDVQYAGIKATSEEGFIVLETLDPESIIRDTKNHFVLFGPRFKMPIRSTQYPVIIDATAMSNYVHQMSGTLKAIQEAKGEPENEPPDVVCSPPAI